jgi:DNA-binding XRE family transcriptional regulator
MEGSPWSGRPAAHSVPPVGIRWSPETQPPKLTLGEWLCIVRARAGISRKELGADLGVSGALVSQWEADDSLPNVEQFRDITELCAAHWLWEAVKDGDVCMGPEAKEVRAQQHT